MWSALLLLSAAADVTNASLLDLKNPLKGLLGGGTTIPSAATAAPFMTLNVTPPVFQISKNSGALAPGFLFIQPMAGPESGSYIMTNTGEMVYAGHGGTNFGPQIVNGKTMLNYWTGTPSSRGFGYGGPNLLNTNYEIVYNVCPMLGLNIPFYPPSKTPKCQSDLHESQATNRGTTVVSAYNVTMGDLSSVGGPKNGYILDSQFHEVEVATNKVVFSWSALAHVPVNKARVPLALAGKVPTKPFDYFHINAIDPLNDGRYLVSSRQTSAVYLLKPNGDIIWEFNGFDGGDFKLPAGKKSQFSFQHDARVQSISATKAVITLFNNNNATPLTLHTSSGIEYELDLVNMKATLKKDLHQALKAVHSTAEGSVQPLPNGNTLVSYGIDPIFQEFGPGGNTDIRLNVNYGDGVKMQRSYRIFKYPWTATPNYPPTALATGGKGYVSWNGATEVTGYMVLTGSSKSNLKAAGSVKKTGFETSFPLPAGTKFMQVLAYKGTKLLNKSLVVKAK